MHSVNGNPTLITNHIRLITDNEVDIKSVYKELINGQALR